MHGSITPVLERTNPVRIDGADDFVELLLRPIGNRRAEKSVAFSLSSHIWKGFPTYIHRLIQTQSIETVCEIGGGANPALSPAAIKQLGVSCTVLDISAEELAKAPDSYQRLQADITAVLPAGHEERFDLIFSRMLAEHVQDPVRFHRNVFNLLRPGGRAVHFFPTLYAPPFFMNWLLPETFSDWIVQKLQPHRTSNGNHGKFPAYYRWCRGPSESSIKRFLDLGFEVEQYVGLFGHSGNVTHGPGYYDSIPPLRAAHEGLAHFLARHPVCCLTSYAFLSLLKPA